jgi:ribose transport system substrate-binding protein
MSRGSLVRNCVCLSAVAAATVLAACGGSDDKSNAKAAAPAPNAAELIGKPTKALCTGKTYTIAFDVFSDTHAFAQANIENFKALAKQLGCVTPVITVDNADPGTAVSNINSFIQRKVDGVVLAQVIAAAQPGIMRALDRAHVPAVATYITAPGAPFISVDDAAAGLQGGQALGQMFAEGPRAKETPYVMSGDFTDGGPTAVARMDSFVKGVQEKVPGVPKDHIIHVETKADPANTNARTLDAIGRVPKGAPILMGAVNDETTQAMLQAAKQTGHGKDVMAIGQGGAPSGRKFICQYPQFVGSVAYYPEKWFDYLLPAVIAQIQGQKVPAKIYIPTKVITKDNLSELYPQDACAS